jgi:prepilin-type N-terminal cleavage/methylation domain-containing protein
MHTAPGRTANHSAFTLIETMLALVIVTMLATLVVPSLLSLRADATTDRAKAEITSALSDARSLARARSMPVIVSITAPDASGESELTGTVITAVENIASSLSSTGDSAEESPSDSQEDAAKNPETDTPIADMLGQSVLSLPMHHDLSDDQIRMVCDALVKVAEAYRK